MITITGDFKKGKEQMKEKRKENMKQLNKLRKKLEKEALVRVSDKEQLEYLGNSIPVYSVSITLPAEIEGLIINGKLLQTFLKKLKGFRKELIVQEESVLLKYGEKQGAWTGEMELYDISSFFEGFTDIPKIERGDSKHEI